MSIRKKKKPATAVKPLPEQVRQLGRMAAKFCLADLRMLHSASAQDFGKITKTKGLPTHVTQEVQVGHSEKASKTLRCVVKYLLEARYSLDKKEEPALILSADFLLTYEKKTPFSDGEIASVTGMIAPFIAWPFWREYVHSTTGKMGFPPLPIPLLNLSDLRD